MIHNRSAKKYLRHVRSMLPSFIRMKKRIMVQIQDEVYSYSEQNPNSDYKALLCRFGEPEVIAASYIESMGTAEVLKRMRIRKWILSAVSAVLAFVVLTWVATVSYEIIKNERNDEGYTEFMVIGDR